MLLRNGLTLIELVVVLTIMAATSGILIPLFTGTTEQAQESTTVQSLVQVRDAVSVYWSDTKHVVLDGIGTVGTEANRLSVIWLFSNPVTDDTTQDFSFNTRIGWRGPYLSGSTGDLVPSGVPTLIDAWNNDILIQDVDSTASLRDVRVVSGGPDGVITIPTTTATASLTTAEVGDDIYVAFTLR